MNAPRPWLPLLVLCGSACIDSVGLPVETDPWFETEATDVLPDPPQCGAASVEPDNFEGDNDYSPIGALQAGRRITFCGRISEARNNGERYTGDIDVGVIELLDDGTVAFELRWADADTDLHLAGARSDDDSWRFGEDGELDLRVDDGEVVFVMIAGASGPPTDYWLDIAVR